MKRAAPKRAEVLPESLVSTVCERLAKGQRVRRVLPGSGRLHIDRQLPFLCLYRQPSQDADTGTAHLVLGQASYLIAAGDEEVEAGLVDLLQQITQTLSGVFGAFLLIEVWSSRPVKTGRRAARTQEEQPIFRIHTPLSKEPPTTVAVLADALREVALGDLTTGHYAVPEGSVAATVEVLNGSIASPPDMPSLLTTSQARKLACLMIGLEIAPVYRDLESGETFPMLLRTLQHGLSRALRKACFEFMHVQTTQRPAHHQMLGRRAMVKAVWETDRQLAAISQSFDFLLAVTPLNIEAAWSEFRESRYQKQPEFRYRLLAHDPDLLKRELYNIPLERIEDPTIAYLFREKRSELDRQITMLDDRSTSRFLPGSLQVYGGVEDNFFHLAKEILDAPPPKYSGPDKNVGSNAAGEDKALEGGNRVDAVRMAEHARREVAFYSETCREFAPQILIRSDVSGIMVSRDRLLIGQHIDVAPQRVEALLQHEVGTHLLTYFNGTSQPLQLLSNGLAGYEELQEGLAVLAEFMVDGLSLSRLRLLAARVLAVRQLVAGATFVEIFRELRKVHGFSASTAFQVTMRVCRGGGFTKDAVYLRGFASLLSYLQKDGAWEPLFAGKIGLSHTPVVKELLWREVLQQGKLQPRWMTGAGVAAKVEALRKGVSVIDLLNQQSPAPY